jgi:hypothetical protein
VKERGYPLPSLANSVRCSAAEGMLTRRISEVTLKKRQHRVEDARVYRSRCIVIEINKAP